MLKLTRRAGESLQIGDHVTLTINEIKGNRVLIGIDAPREVQVVRQEVLDRERREATGSQADAETDNARQVGE